MRVIRDVWIRPAGQKKGAQYVDRGLLFFNANGQALFISTEFKTRGAAGGLRPQIAARDARLLDVRHPEGTKLTYRTERSSVTSELDLENVILIGPNSPTSLREANLRSKLGVRAGDKFKLSVAKDARGELYVRIAVAVQTNSLRRILEQVLRDRTWQTLP